MTIRFKLILACLLLLTLNAGLGLFARHQQHQMGERAMGIYDGAYLGLHYIAEVQVGLTRFAAAHAGSSTADPSETAINTASQAILQQLMSKLDVAIERAMSDKARIGGRALMEHFAALSRETVPALFTGRLTEIDRALLHLVHRYNADGLAARDDVEASVESSDTLVLTVSTATVLASFSIALLLGLSILPPLRRAVTVADSIAGGKLDTVITAKGHSETARLMRALDSMQSAIVENMRRIQDQRAAEAALREENLRRENEEARERQRIAEETSRAKSAFLAMMSHEIRTPMNAVLGLASTLLDETLTVEQRNAVRAIHDSGGNLLRILNDILDFSRLDAGRMTFEPVAFSPAALTRQTLSAHGPAAAEKGVRLGVTLDPDLPPWLTGDTGRIGQVLHNLVSNAIKFTRAGAVTVEARRVEPGRDSISRDSIPRDSTPGGSIPGDLPENDGTCPEAAADNAAAAMVTIEWIVTDSGIGIAPAQLNTLFDAFVQADNSITRRFGGSGLGLAICRQLAEQMGGVVTVASVPGEGSTFRFQLTLEPADEQQSASPEAPPDEILLQRLKTLHRPLRLLLAEDNTVNKLVFSRMLKGLPIDITIASDGAEAVAAAGKTAYDMICMDMSMPEMDGLEATRAIRRGNGPCRAAPIIAMTANAFPEDVEACRAAGMNDFVSKPISKAILVNALSRAMALEGGSLKVSEKV